MSSFNPSLGNYSSPQASNPYYPRSNFPGSPMASTLQSPGMMSFPPPAVAAQTLPPQESSLLSQVFSLKGLAVAGSLVAAGIAGHYIPKKFFKAGEQALEDLGVSAEKKVENFSNHITQEAHETTLKTLESQKQSEIDALNTKIGKLEETAKQSNVSSKNDIDALKTKLFEAETKLKQANAQHAKQSQQAEQTPKTFSDHITPETHKTALESLQSRMQNKIDVLKTKIGKLEETAKQSGISAKNDIDTLPTKLNQAETELEKTKSQPAEPTPKAEAKPDQAQAEKTPETLAEPLFENKQTEKPTEDLKPKQTETTKDIETDKTAKTSKKAVAEAEQTLNPQAEKPAVAKKPILRINYTTTPQKNALQKGKPTTSYFKFAVQNVINPMASVAAVYAMVETKMPGFTQNLFHTVTGSARTLCKTSGVEYK